MGKSNWKGRKCILIYLMCSLGIASLLFQNISVFNRQQWESHFTHWRQRASFSFYANILIRNFDSTSKQNLSQILYKTEKTQINLQNITQTASDNSFVNFSRIDTTDLRTLSNQIFNYRSTQATSHLTPAELSNRSISYSTSCELVRDRLQPPQAGGDRCTRIRQLVSQGLLEYVLREGDDELCALVRPLFRRRKLVIWTSDHHSAPVYDLRSLLEPLGVEFIDHTLYHNCRHFCHCNRRSNLKVLDRQNVLKMTPQLIADFQKAYPNNDTEMARVDAFAMFYCSSQYEMFRSYNKSIISIAALRYETCRNPRRWSELNGNISELSGRREHVIGANNQYDKEYIGYFTGLNVELLPSFCLYTGGVYNPIHNTYLFSPQRSGLSGAFASLWNREFDTHYKRLNATFVLDPLRGKNGLYESWHWAGHLGIVNVPYQVSTMSVFEQYHMNIPLFFPAHATFVEWNIKHRLLYDRTSAMLWGFSTGSDIKPHASRRAIPDPNDERDPNSQSYWLRLSDFYTLPHVVHFGSVQELVELLHSVTRERLFAISADMRAFNRSQLKHLLHFWRERLVDIANASQNHPD